NCPPSSRQIERVSRAESVQVSDLVEMHATVAQEIHAQHQTGPQFMLDAGVKHDAVRPFVLVEDDAAQGVQSTIEEWGSLGWIEIGPQPSRSLLQRPLHQVRRRDHVLQRLPQQADAARTLAGRGVEVGDVKQALAIPRVGQYWVGTIQYWRVVAQAGRKVEHAVEEEIVDDVGVVVDARPRADYELPVAVQVIREAELWTKVVLVIVRLAGECRAELGQHRRTRQIAVRKRAVIDIAQGVVERKVALDLPGVGEI